jgi:NAD(P)-dependent dehydrogenase (short-subunit alcohol dehydrogenase family)
VPMTELAGQVVLVTGASGGLGPHAVKAFRDAGSQVIASARNIADSGFAFPADLTIPAEAHTLVETVVERFGRIDVLAHVAGGFSGGTPVHEAEDGEWQRMLALNAGAAFHVFRAVLPHMRRARRGRIIAFGSRAAVEPAPNIAAYSASKAALVSLVRTVAIENRDAGITANVILPGTIDTEANRRADPAADRSRWVSPVRLAALAVFLATEAAGGITGAAIPVYGAGL